MQRPHYRYPPEFICGTVLCLAALLLTANAKAASANDKPLTQAEAPEVHAGLAGSWIVRVQTCKALLVLQATQNPNFFVGLMNEICRDGSKQVAASQEVKMKVSGQKATLIGTLLPGESGHGISPDSFLLSAVSEAHMEGTALGYPSDIPVKMERVQ